MTYLSMLIYFKSPLTKKWVSLYHVLSLYPVRHNTTQNTQALEERAVLRHKLTCYFSYRIPEKQLLKMRKFH